MLNVFMEKSAEGLHVKLSDGRLMPLEDLVRDYERLLRESSKKEVIAEVKAEKAKAEKKITEKLKVGKWFRIDRNVIDEHRDEIHQKCIEIGADGEKLWKTFEESNEIANQNPDQYPRVMETYIFKRKWNYKEEQEMRDMCKEIGDGICDEVICYLELQMRICNGEAVESLIHKPDKLPRVRFIKLTGGKCGYWGGGADNYNRNPPAALHWNDFVPYMRNFDNVPYAFRKVPSKQ